LIEAWDPHDGQSVAFAQLNEIIVPTSQSVSADRIFEPAGFFLYAFSE
jgi:hypothetical protein